MADDIVPPVGPIRRVRRVGRVLEPNGRSGLGRWMARITRDQFRVGWSLPRDGAATPLNRTSDEEAVRRAWEDELTGEGKFLDVDG